MPKFLAPSLLVGDNRVQSPTGTTSHKLTSNGGTAAQGNLTIGHGAGGTPSTTLSFANIAIGPSALAGINANNSDNVAIGYQALQTGTGCYKSIAIGSQALQSYSGNGGSVGIGYQAGKGQTGGLNVFIGNGTGAATGANNDLVMVGALAGPTATGMGSTLIGSHAAQVMTTAINNTFVGSSVAAAVTTGGGNVAVGTAAAATLTTGTANTIIGNGADTTAAANSATAIGAAARANANGSVAIGCDSAGTGASTSVVNEIKLGTASHALNVIGNVSLGGTGKTMGFLGATPVARSAGWTVTAGYTADKVFDPTLTTVDEIAAVLGTLIDTLKTYGLLGA